MPIEGNNCLLFYLKNCEHQVYLSELYEVVLITCPEHGERHPDPGPDLLHAVSVLLPRGEGDQPPRHWPHLLHGLATSSGLKLELASIMGLLEVQDGGHVNESLLKRNLKVVPITSSL